MIKLRDILKEIDFGKIPLSDPLGVEYSDAYSTYLKKWNYIEEPNTEDEQAFVNDLKSYIDEPNVHSSQAAHIASVLKELLPLKSKFPGILDPAQSAKFVYRGTTIPIKSFINSTSNLEGDDLIFNVKTKLTAKGERNFLSFSANQYIAEDFVDQQISIDEGELAAAGLVPAVIVLNSSNANLIFNSNITKFFSDIVSDEQETFHIGTTLTTDKIILPSTIYRWLQQSLNNIPTQYQEDFTKLRSLYN